MSTNAKLAETVDLSKRRKDRIHLRMVESLSDKELRRLNRLACARKHEFRSVVEAIGRACGEDEDIDEEFGEVALALQVLEDFFKVHEKWLDDAP